MISLVLITSFIILYAAFGTGLILEGIGVWKRKTPSSATTVSTPYANIGDPPSQQLTRQP